MSQVDVGRDRILAEIDGFFGREPVAEPLRRLKDLLPGNAELWVAGGSLRNLIIPLYHGFAPPTGDIDLFVAGVGKDFSIRSKLPRAETSDMELGGVRWAPSDSPYFFDICPLGRFVIIQRHGLAPTVENLLKCIDFTMNAVLFCFERRLFQQREALSAIERRTIEFNTRRIYSRLLLTYRVVRMRAKTGFLPDREVFEFVRTQIDLETMDALKILAEDRLGVEEAREVLAEFDRIGRYRSYSDYCESIRIERSHR